MANVMQIKGCKSLGGGGGAGGRWHGAVGVRSPKYFGSMCTAEPVFLNVFGAQESIPRNEFRQPM
jgi:hypothetical protein